MLKKQQEAISFSNPTTSTTSPITLTSQEDTLSNYLIETPQINSAPNSYQNEYNNSILYDGGGGGGGGGATCSGNNDPEYGFIRPDFRAEMLVASVEFYQRHVFLCYKNPRNWPPRIEAAEFDRLPRLLSAALSARKPDLYKETRLTICEGRDGTETSNGDVLIFPDMIRYRRLTHFDVDTFVEEVLVKDGEWLPGNPEKLKGCYIFVCCHGSRDRRCGVCGPPLVAKFKEEVDVHGLQGKVSISPCSHVGGHKYAGNVIIFGSRANAEVTGHWYGYVTPEDVPNLFEQHVMKGEIVEWLWRGQMNLSEEGQQKAQELRLQNKEGNTAGRSRQFFPELAEINSPTYGSHTGGSNSCCQANGNAACCQNTTSAGKEEDMNFHGEGKSRSGRKGKKLLRHNSYNGFGKRKVCTMPSWLESWEREDTYAALAVVCAAVSVGIAYSCYKRL